MSASHRAGLAERLGVASSATRGQQCGLGAEPTGFRKRRAAEHVRPLTVDEDAPDRDHPLALPDAVAAAPGLPTHDAASSAKPGEVNPEVGIITVANSCA